MAKEERQPSKEVQPDTETLRKITEAAQVAKSMGEGQFLLHLEQMLKNQETPNTN